MFLSTVALPPRTRSLRGRWRNNFFTHALAHP